MKRRLLHTAGLICIAAQATASTGEIVSGAHRIIPLAENVYAVEALFAGADSAFIVNDDGVTVVDTHGSPASAATLIDEIAKVTDVPIRYVVNTHWHVDHHSGNQAYYDAYPDGVEFIAHHATREDIPTAGREQFLQMGPFKSMPLETADERLAEGLDDHGRPLGDAQRRQITKFRDAQRSFIAAGDEFEFVLPNLTVERSLVIHGDPSPIHVLFLGRAHTRGDVVVYVPDSRIAIVGDILTRPILWTWSSYPAAYVGTLRAIEALEIDRLVIGHGGPVLEGKEYLTSVRESLQSIVEFAREADARSLSPEDAIAEARSDERVQALRQHFVEDDEQQEQMFQQMVAWTIERAMAEARGELD